MELLGAGERTAKAAFALAAALFALQLGPRSSAPAPCFEPAEQLAYAGHSAAVRCDGDAMAPSLRGPARLLFGLRLDPNRADRASLEALPGIGPVRAAAIETERCRRPFASVAELERVPGIGPRSRARLEPWLAVSAAVQARCPAVQ
jgi:DNA uptake protein ComE-like DNA-binding protein